jgi:hypothetical protein
MPSKSPTAEHTRASRGRGDAGHQFCRDKSFLRTEELPFLQLLEFLTPQMRRSSSERRRDGQHRFGDPEGNLRDVREKCRGVCRQAFALSVKLDGWKPAVKIRLPGVLLVVRR